MDWNQGKCNSFYIGCLSPGGLFRSPATPFNRVFVKSGADPRRVVRIVVVVASVRIDVAEIIAIVVVRGAEPPPHSRTAH